MIELGPSRQGGPDAGRRVVISASLDNLQSPDVRFLQEAARLGRVHLDLWSDTLVEATTGRPPAFPQQERLFIAEALRDVDSASVADRLPAAALADLAAGLATLVVPAAADDPDLRARCRALGVEYRVIGADQLVGFPPAAGFPQDAGFPPTEGTSAAPSSARRVVVTGCFDWLHSGHVRFFLDAAALGELYVIVGSDENVRLLKGPGHPLRSQDERRYMVQAVRCVHRGLISSGSGWMDAEPEINAIAPQVYVVNEDGDQPEKRAFCRAHGLDYVVLERRPHRDLPKRTSTELRGY
jgi:cytidyltransferase-like protein